jgi:hypothetical protein
MSWGRVAIGLLAPALLGRRIAHEGMEQLASFLVAPPDRVPAPPALPTRPAPAASTVMAATTHTGNTAALAAAQ